MHDSKKNTVISITTGTLIKGLAIIAGFWVLYILRDLILVVLTAVILASSIEPAVKFFKRYRIPRIPAVLTIYLTLVGFVVGIAYIFIPPLFGDFADFAQRLPAIASEVNSSIFGENPEVYKKSQTIITQVSQEITPNDLISSLGNISNASKSITSTIRVVFGGIFSFILIVILSFYFAMQERGIENFLRIIIPFSKEAYAINLWERSRNKIGKWMQGQLLLGVLIFVLVYLGLTIFGIPYALSLALLAGILEIIPIFGPILAAIPAVAIAYTSGGAGLSLIIVGFYVLVQQFESHLIYPLVVRKVVGVPSILVILALIIGSKLAGFLGILIAIPVAAALMEIVEDIERKKGIM
jgi:predicted PurR-regulated permease PerM